MGARPKRGPSADARAAVAVATDQVQDLLQDVRAAAAGVLSDPAFWDGDDEARDTILARLAAPRPEFNAVLFYTEDLQQHGASNQRPGAPRPDVTSRNYAREAVATGQPAFTGEALRALTTGVPVLPVAIPVRDGGRPGATGGAGLVIVGLRLERLPAVWAGLALPAESAVALVDVREGRVLAASDPAAGRVNERLAFGDLDRFRRGERAFRTAAPDLDQGGASRLRAWGVIVDTPWAVVVDIPVAAVLNPIAVASGRRVLVALALAGAVLVPLLLLWRRLAGGTRRPARRRRQRGRDRGAADQAGRHGRRPAGRPDRGGAAPAGAGADLMSADDSTRSPAPPERRSVARGASRPPARRR